jgi:archaellum component FlaC
VAAKPKQATTAPRVPLTAAQQQQQAKLKREQMNDAFHGRLAGIKHNVDALNSRLTDFEDKVNKEDNKLEKGDPDDFQINLD